MTGRDTQPARAGGELAIGGDPPIVRLGYGATQIRGPAVWGEPCDHDDREQPQDTAAALHRAGSR
jgi:hypothetical protein